MSFQLFDSNVTASAMTAAATFGSAVTSVVVALKFPWTYTGFSDAIVSPGAGTLLHGAGVHAPAGGADA